MGKNVINKKSVIGRILDVGICAIFLVFIFVGYDLIIWLNENYDNSAIFRKITTPVHQEPIELPSQIPTIEEPGDISDVEDIPPVDPTIYDIVKGIGVNFDELKAINNETVAWLRVNGIEELDYPVVQTKNNSFYLEHNFEKKWNSAGWVFSDTNNDLKNMSLNCVFYGHARKDGTMFGSLYRTQYSKWYSNKNNHYIYLTTEHDVMVYQVFSVYKTDTSFFYIQTDFSSKQEYKDFLLEIIQRNTVKAVNYGASPLDSIITLSTCTANENERYVVHAKLVKSEANPTLEGYASSYYSLPD